MLSTLCYTEVHCVQAYDVHFNHYKWIGKHHIFLFYTYLNNASF